MRRVLEMDTPACSVNDRSTGQIHPGESVADYCRRRGQEIPDERRTQGRAHRAAAAERRIRYAPAPEVDLPASLSISVPVPRDGALSGPEWRYMMSLDGWELGPNEGALYEALAEGRDAAITAGELVRRLVLPSARAVSAAVECLRANGFPICSTPADPAGYWRAATAEEFAATVRALICRALRQLYVARQMEQSGVKLFPGAQIAFELEETAQEVGVQ